MVCFMDAPVTLNVVELESMKRVLEKLPVVPTQAVDVENVGDMTT